MKEPKTLRFIGRLGNCLFQYAHARAWCEKNNCELHTEAWIGTDVFDLKDPGAIPGQSDFNGYKQRQEDLIYTQSQALQWFRLKPEIQQKLQDSVVVSKLAKCRAHIRRGDYAKLNYVVVHKDSYWKAVSDFGLPDPSFVTEERPCLIPGLPDWLPDFYRLMNSRVLLRGNSTFSWWAAVLGCDKEVYSPVIDGLEPGERVCPFVKGNHPKFVDHPNVTDLHLEP